MNYRTNIYKNSLITTKLFVKGKVKTDDLLLNAERERN